MVRLRLTDRWSVRRDHFESERISSSFDQLNTFFVRCRDHIDAIDLVDEKRRERIPSNDEDMNTPTSRT